jgi:signal transduction histidine kinase
MPVVVWRDVVAPEWNQESVADVVAQLEVLRIAARGFDSSLDPAKARRAAIVWLRQAAGTDDVTVRLYLPDRSGALRLAAFEGDRTSAGRKRSARRQSVFQGSRVVRVEMPHVPGRTLAILPLVHRGESLGVVEVVAPTAVLDQRWETLNAVVCQASVAFHDLRERDEADRASQTLQQSIGLVGRLLHAKSAQAAVKIAVAVAHERFRVPVAGWALDGRPDTLLLAAAKGMGSRHRAELRSQMGELPQAAALRDADRRGLTGRFRRVMGAGDASVVIAGGGILMAADLPLEARGSLRALSSLLGVVLQHQAKMDRGELLHQQVDAGIAWTAHEFRGPVLGTKAALDFLLEAKEDHAFTQDVLRRSSQQLELLAEDVGALLRWAADDRLSRSVVDLVEVVKKAIESTAFWHGEGRVALEVRSGALVKASTVHLRRAIANVVQNALQYSPENSTAFVEVSRQDGFATVSVSDLGPGIAKGEQEEIFEPFVRGRAAKIAGGGRGLGLFVTKRVIESHGGWIRAESSGLGATFCIGLPVVSGSQGRARRKE